MVMRKLNDGNVDYTEGVLILSLNNYVQTD